MVISLFVVVAVWRPVDSVEYARQIRAQVDMAAIRTQLDSYRKLNGFYPTTEQGLDALVTRAESSPIPARWMQHFKEVPRDAWQHPYVYRYPSSKAPSTFDIFCLGPDGVESSDDIYPAP